jgi:group I intron endonuclease
MHYIYVIQNKLNLKLYIGQTNNPNYRWQKHKHHAAVGDRNQPIYLALRKYGSDNFTFQIIEEHLLLDDCNEAEEFWIEFFQSRKKEFGYNIAFGGNNKTVAPETRLRISKTLTGKPSKSSTKFKKGHNINIGAKAFGSILTDEKVMEIISLLKDKSNPQKDIAKLYGVSVPTISMIANNKIWKHIPRI